MPDAPPPELGDPRAPRVRRIRSLAGRSARARHGRFLIEGPQGVREAVHHRRDLIHEVYLTAAAARRYPEILAAAPAARFGTEAVLAAMSPDAQGVLAVAAIEPQDASAAFEDVALGVLLHEVRDPGNAGTVIRAADAAGAQAVLLTAASVEVHNPKVVRSSAGSLFHLPVHTGLALAATAQRARDAGLQVLAADGAGQVDLDRLIDGPQGALDLRRRTLWVFGNEAHGLAGADLQADATVRIGLRGHAESLNLAMAATLCLFASARAQG